MNPARQAAIGAGLPVRIPALTVNRMCGSGAQVIASASPEILAGYASCTIAGGMENMDQAPYLVPGGRTMAPAYFSPHYFIATARSRALFHLGQLPGPVNGVACCLRALGRT
jgi:acetyl-CoA acetyltransferase